MTPRRRSVLQRLAATSALPLIGTCHAWSQTTPDTADLILRNSRITTIDPAKGGADAIAIAEGRVFATGPDAEVMKFADGDTADIDLAGRSVIPGLHDSHTHLIHDGL